MDVKFYTAVATLIGTIIGAGILGIPYVIAKSGFIIGIIDLILIGIFMLMLNLFLGEVVSRTKETHQLPGYAGMYLGKPGRKLMLVSMIIGIYGALIAYLIGSGEALRAISGALPVFFYSVIFFLAASMIVFLGVKTMGKTELVVMGFLMLVIIAVCIAMAPKITPSNLSSFNPGLFFVPYGVLLFAYLGMTAIPVMKEEMGKSRLFKKAILLGSIIPIIIYAMFALSVVGSIGLQGFQNLRADQRVATVALGAHYGSSLLIYANIFAVLAMFTSFIALGIALKEMYLFDYRFSRQFSSFLVVIVPFAVFLFDAFIRDITNFIRALDIAGAVSGGITGSLIVLMFWKAKKLGNRTPEFTIKKTTWLGILLIALFFAGIVYEILSLLKIF